MSVKEKDKQEVSTKVEKEIKKYEFAHLVQHCGKCNSKLVLKSDVQDGITIAMPTASNAEIVLVCKECNNTMALYFVESDGSTKKVEAENIDVKNAVQNKDGSITGELDGEQIEVPADAVYEPKMEVVE